MIIKSEEEIKASLDNYHVVQSRITRDRAYRPMPVPGKDQSVSTEWMKVCRAFSIMNLPTVKDRSSAMAGLQKKKDGEEILKIIDFYDGFFRSYG